MEGEICFDVARKEEQPFVVRTADLAVKVLGTLFNMEAYPEDSRVTTTLVRGKVEVAVGIKLRYYSRISNCRWKQAGLL